MAHASPPSLVAASSGMSGTSPSARRRLAMQAASRSINSLQQQQHLGGTGLQLMSLKWRSSVCSKRNLPAAACESPH